MHIANNYAEEHVGIDLFPSAFTTPFNNFTNEVGFDSPAYLNDLSPRLVSIDSRVAAMDAANISIQILLFRPVGIQGIFNTTFATQAASRCSILPSRLEHKMLTLYL